MTERTLNILQTTTDKRLFGAWFTRTDTWSAWFAFLAALFGLPMTPEQIEIYRQCTGRSTTPTTPAKDGWLICGRRSGKSFVLALCAVFLACFRDWRPYLARGERATILIVAVDRRQARTVLRYIRALLGVPVLAKLVERETAESFDLSNAVTIEIHTASFRTTRGYSIAAALLDELAFWPVDEFAADPDREVINAIRPGMVTIPNALLLCASSPYARKGALFDAHRKHFGKDGDPILVWQAATRVMNPTVPQSVIDAAMEADPAYAAAEYGAQFRSEIEGFINRELLAAAVVPGRYELPRIGGARYCAFADPSAGVSDSFTAAISQRMATRWSLITCSRRGRRSTRWLP